MIDTLRELQLPTLQTAKFVAKKFPLRGKEAGDNLRWYFAGVTSPAEKMGLTEADVMQILTTRPEDSPTFRVQY